MSKKGGEVVSLVALILQNKMAQTTYKRSQGTMAHVVLTSREIQSNEYISLHTLQITFHFLKKLHFLLNVILQIISGATNV